MVRPSGQIRLDIFTRGVFPTASLILLRGGPYPSPRALANSRDGVVVVVVDTEVLRPRLPLPPPTEKAETKNLRLLHVDPKHTKAPYMVTRFKNLENFMWVVIRNDKKLSSTGAGVYDAIILLLFYVNVVSYYHRSHNDIMFLCIRLSVEQKDTGTILYTS